MPESEPRLIGPAGTEPDSLRGYLAILAARLPPSVTDELADGLTETYRHYLSRGLTPEAAAEITVAEFGAPEEIAAGFAEVNPARRAARRLLRIGPVVGVCWVAALGRRYRLATATGVAGCFGYAALDAALIVAAILVLAPMSWLTMLAMAASSARIAVTAKALRPALIR